MNQLQAIRSFARIVETASFTKAADSLDMPKATISKHVQDLEAHLGVRLIQRKHSPHHGRQNSLALALREIGRIERSLFMLAWLEDPALRRRVTAGLNKGEARNSLARAVSSIASAKSVTDLLRINGIAQVA